MGHNQWNFFHNNFNARPKQKSAEQPVALQSNTGTTSHSIIEKACSLKNPLPRKIPFWVDIMVESEGGSGPELSRIVKCDFGWELDGRKSSNHVVCESRRRLFKTKHQSREAAALASNTAFDSPVLVFIYIWCGTCKNTCYVVGKSHTPLRARLKPDSESF